MATDLAGLDTDVAIFVNHEKDGSNLIIVVAEIWGTVEFISEPQTDDFYRKKAIIGPLPSLDWGPYTAT
ncbi:hypothetical protein E2562_019963 [Oryza meyeriana var. granulata]|uniref:Uncharacterized protein n=1 Tax=Oryza meyeriana var. granulata TaxID=110450 RepID=A0A6G1CH49_9ORYZ|nr:hypothetical protein E2562_019963 [Oryza meyeriana var. granulata]